MLSATYYDNISNVLCVLNILNQACQTQTTLRAAKATKNDEGAAKVLKNSFVGYINQNWRLKITL